MVGGGIGLGELLICAAVFVLLFVIGAVLLLVRNRAASGSGGPAAAVAAPRAHEVVFFLRFEGADDESYVRDLIARHAGIRTVEQAREAALDVVRAAPTATHAFVGPANEAPEGVAACGCGLPGGVVLGFSVRARRPMSTVADDQDLRSVVAELRQIAAWTPADFASASIAASSARLGAQPTLVSVRDEARPGHQICVFCRTAFLAHDTRCPSCGARPST